MKYVKTFESYSADDTDPLRKMLEAMSKFGSGMQKKLAKEKLSVMKPVKCVRLKDAIGPEAVEKVKIYVRPEKKNCYANALHVAEYLREHDVKYCEGWLIMHGLPIEHAFNKTGDTYFDVTEEFALDGDPAEYTYVVLGEWDPDTALQVMATGPYKCYGEVFDKEFISKHPENIK